MTVMRSAARAGAYGVVIDGVRSHLHLDSWRTVRAMGTVDGNDQRAHFPPDGG